MATNLLPILLLGGAAYFLMSRKEGEEEAVSSNGGGGDGGTDPTEGFGSLDTPCQRMKGIYEFRQASNEFPDSLTADPSLKRLPLSMKAFEMLRGMFIGGLEENWREPGVVLMDSLNMISKMSPDGAAFEQMDCNWAQGLSEGRMKQVFLAAETLMYRVQCYNQFGVWTPAVGNNLPVTKEYYDEMVNRFTNMKASNPTISRAAAILDALENGFDTNACEWRGSAMAYFSDRQRDVMEATGAIFDQVFEA